MSMELERLERRVALAKRGAVLLLLALTVSGYVMAGAMIYHFFTWDAVEPLARPAAQIGHP